MKMVRAEASSPGGEQPVQQQFQALLRSEGLHLLYTQIPRRLSFMQEKLHMGLF